MFCDNKTDRVKLSCLPFWPLARTPTQMREPFLGRWWRSVWQICGADSGIEIFTCGLSWLPQVWNMSNPLLMLLMWKNVWPLALWPQSLLPQVSMSPKGRPTCLQLLQDGQQKQLRPVEGVAGATSTCWGTSMYSRSRATLFCVIVLKTVLHLSPLGYIEASSCSPCRDCLTMPPADALDQDTRGICHCHSLAVEEPHRMCRDGRDAPLYPIGALHWGEGDCLHQLRNPAHTSNPSSNNGAWMPWVAWVWEDYAEARAIAACTSRGPITNKNQPLRWDPHPNLAHRVNQNQL